MYDCSAHTNSMNDEKVNKATKNVAQRQNLSLLFLIFIAKDLRNVIKNKYVSIVSNANRLKAAFQGFQATTKK